MWRALVVVVGLGAACGAGPALLSATPAKQTFDPVVVGEVSADVVIAVANPGGSASGAIAITLDDPQFAISANTCYGALAAGEGCTVTVHFAPTTPGAATAILAVSAGPGLLAEVALTGTGIGPPGLAIAPASKDFMLLQFGVGAPTTFTVTSSGTGPTGPLTVALGGADADQFQLGASTCGPALAPGATCTVDVATNPTRSGALSALLVVSTAGASAQAQLSASCCAPPALVIDAQTHDFGSQAVGTNSAAFGFTITNNNLQTTGSISAVLAGANGTDFTLASGCTTLEPGVSCIVTVMFSPGSTGAKIASLDIVASPGGAPTAMLLGTGVVPTSTNLGISPASIDFGYLQPGMGMPTTFTVTNLDGMLPTAALTVALAGANPTQFQLGATTCGPALAAGATCTVDVTPAQTFAGPHGASLSVSTQGGEVTALLAAGCCAPPGLAVTPAMHGFGSQTAGTTSSDYAFTVINNGASPTTAITAQLTGADLAAFQITSNTCTTLSNGASCTVYVAFAPGTSGAKSAVLAVTAGTGGESDAALTGTGL